ncbi:hypothetical protein H257_16307 [Aphanomyces astaci]|uniref:DUF6818 domain-containing protein n=1 Tax=Aphanomyces astaci TaxID=112090 RepID=W4FL44_APHAT|nr:hypothetical protein H257_16307 [Aphanomyces astaci]ETV67581.1 hypothetical protein H257_16307 [Aphanomyces astaci]|eukprot:XP_009842985.1 hypothetical protein H257_16307 [Aphanomyces astaci]
MSKSSKRRGKNWCVASVDLMLDKVESIIPMGKNAWRKVEIEFNTAASGFPHRDAESLKRKYQQLRNNPKPTGDPECPMDVRRAKWIVRDIDNKADVLALEDDCEEDDEQNVKNCDWSVMMLGVENRLHVKPNQKPTVKSAKIVESNCS